MFDHSDSHNFEFFNIHDESEKFIQTFIDYILINNDKFDLNNFSEHNDDDNFIIIQKNIIKKNIKIQFEQQFMIIYRTIVYRKTICYCSKNEKKS